MDKEQGPKRTRVGSHTALIASLSTQVADLQKRVTALETIEKNKIRPAIRHLFEVLNGIEKILSQIVESK